MAHHASGFAVGFDPTGRCHKREFLLKFAKDRHRWLQWLYQARKRYHLIILNYVVTSNHIHLLVYDRDGDLSIQKSIQLVAGRTGQEYNIRKRRKGAFWEDRYHATVIEEGEHLLRCIVYIDMNMVRAGVVQHPKDWPHGGYREIQAPRRKCVLIDNNTLCRLAGYKSIESFQGVHRTWIDAEAGKDILKREARWTEAIAVGKERFIQTVKKKMRAMTVGRKIIGHEDCCELREEVQPYIGLSDLKK